MKGRGKLEGSSSTQQEVKRVKRISKYEFNIAAVAAIILGVAFYLVVPLLVINLSFLIVLESGSELLVMMNAVAALLILQSQMSACAGWSRSTLGCLARGGSVEESKDNCASDAFL